MRFLEQWCQAMCVAVFVQCHKSVGVRLTGIKHLSTIQHIYSDSTTSNYPKVSTIKGMSLQALVIHINDHYIILLKVM